MPTPLNQSLADSALLTKSLPLGLLRAFVQTNAADDGLTPQLLAELKILARTPGLLVACNYGGTLCEAEGISTETLPLGSAAIALRALAALPNTHAAVISGRSLRDLAAVSRLPAEVHLVGSHGAEFDMGFAHGLSLATESVLQQASQALAETVGAYRGITIERKPVAVSVHTRPATPDVVALVTQQAEEIAKAHGLSFIVDGSVLDLSVVEPSKGAAMEHLRSMLGVSAALYAGDASSDEAAMATLRGPDLGLRVGEGPTAAAHRLRDPESFARVLAILFELRRAWLFGEDAVGLERHSMIGNGSSTALITPDARICWMSHPLPDSGSLFAHLLGGDAAGHFSVEPVKASQVLGQRYVDSTMIVETRWADVTVTDYLEPAPEGITSLVRVLSGTGTARIVFAPRPDYANAPFSMEARGAELHVVGTADPIILLAPGVGFTITSDGRHATATADVELRHGPVVLNLRCGDTEPQRAEPPEENSRRAAVAHHSRRWVQALQLPAVKPSLVRRSALVLARLVHEPTGAVLAAPTTSLPEGIGGTRNWDYRYCWLRDGSMTVNALVDLGSTAEAEGFLAWLGRIPGPRPGPEWLHPLYSVTGAPLSTEAIIESLPRLRGLPAGADRQRRGPPGAVGRLRAGRRTDRFPQRAAGGPGRCPLGADGPDGLGRAGPLARGRPRDLGGPAGTAAPHLHQGDVLGGAGPGPAHRRPARPDTASGVGTGGRDHPGGSPARRLGQARPPTPWPTTARTWTRPCCTSGSPAPRRLRPALPGHRHGGGTGTAGGSHRVPLPVRRRTAGPGGRLHICTTWLIEAYVAVGRIEEAWDLFDQLVNLFGPTRAAAGGVRPRHRNPPREPPAGVLTPGLHPLRPAAGRAPEELGLRWSRGRAQYRYSQATPSRSPSIFAR